MPERGIGNEVQARAMADQVAEAAVAKFAQSHPEKSIAAEIPAPLKWAGAVIAAAMSAALIGMCFWVVSTLSDLQQTVTRIDERQKLVGDSGDRRFTEIERRVTALEALHQEGKMKR